MKDSVADHRTGCRADERVALPVVAYVAEYRAALWHAARFLGGYEAARLVDQLAAALQQDPRLSARVRSMLDRLLSLLTLEHVHDPDRPEMAYFVAIAPGDPVMEEICLLADGLRSAIDASDAFGRKAAAVRRRAA